MTYSAAAINRKCKIVLLTDNTVIPFENMIGIDGEETDDPDECTFAVFQLPNKLWAFIDLSDFDELTVH